MAVNKYVGLNLTTGTLDEVVPGTTGGATDANKIPGLSATGQLTLAMMPTGIGADTVSATASEALSGGDFINLYVDVTPSILRCRKADATTTGKEANGFVLDSVENGATATVYREGTNTALTSLTIGTDYFLAKVAGGVTSDVSAYTTDNSIQYLGQASSETALRFEYFRRIKVA